MCLQNGCTHHRKIGYLLLITLLVLVSGCSNSAYPIDHEQLSEDERIVIRFSHVVGEQTPKGLAARKFAKLVKERSNGFIEVQVFPNGNLYKDGEELDALNRGDIQMVAPSTSKLTPIVPEWQVMDLPFAFRNSSDVQDYLQGEIGQKLLAKLNKEGLYPLGIWDNGFKQMTSQYGPLIKPKDFAGQRFRVMPSTVIEDQFKALQVDTQIHSFDEVYQLLNNGIIDGQENTFSNIVSKDLHSLQNYLTISDHGYLGYVVLMNLEFWESLSLDVQKLLTDTFREVTEWEVELAQELNEKNQQDIEQCGCIEIHRLTEEEKQLWEDALQPVYRNFEDRFRAEYIEQLPKNKEAQASH
ncbi:DctP family TRAP transporter solute-binding subunit [Bacillus pinisoli]|uniref:DctP family TRAP transporter solute-binding subunit n=1 Tax=Bacillus pinisoli TaxID=2901866 RepID=UPI001FF4A0A6